MQPSGFGLLAEEDDGEGEAIEDETPAVELQLEPSGHLELRQFVGKLRRRKRL